MGYLKFQADRLFDGVRFRDSESVLITDKEGTIVEITTLENAGDEIQRFEGFLMPGMINAHCHLELSHLKNCIPPHTGLPTFLKQVVALRSFDPGEVALAIETAAVEMQQNGIVAVGDICNKIDTASFKASSKIRWHNFIEVISFTNAKAEENLARYQEIAKVFEEHSNITETIQRTTLVPHAPYTVSPEAFKKLNELTKCQLISIHNQECAAENEMYEKGSGAFYEFFQQMNIPVSDFPITHKSSLQSYLPYFNQSQTLLLIHNTTIASTDLSFAIQHAQSNKMNIHYCLCVNANLYIENKLPPIPMLLDAGVSIVLGTDSYSSNWQLSIIKEVQTIHQNFPSIPLETILQWATLQGAQAFGWEKELGSFEKGKRPGVLVVGEDWGVRRYV